MPKSQKRSKSVLEQPVNQNGSFLKRKSAWFLKQIHIMQEAATGNNKHFLDESNISVQLQQLERLQVQFEEVQSQLEMEDNDEIESSARVKFLEAFVIVKSNLTKVLGRSIAEARSSTRRQSLLEEPSASNIASSSKSRWPALQLPHFTGVVTEWPDFWSLFSTVVDSEASLSGIEKFQHLRASLSGVALEVIRSLEINNENYSQAVELLKRRFDIKRIQFQAHIKELFGLKTVAEGSASGLRQLSDKISAHLRALQTIATKDELLDGLLIYLVSSKADVATQSKWEEVSPAHDLPSWDSMLLFLEKRARILENVDIALVAKTPGKQVTNKKSFRQSFITTNSAKNCTFCSSLEHSISSFSSFLNLSPSLRFKEAKKLQLCINCLKKRHSTKNCKSGGCKYCSYKHNTLLHLSSVVQPTFENTQIPCEAKTTLVTNSKHIPQAFTSDSCETKTTLVTDSKNVPRFHEQSSVSKRFIMLATAVVMIQNRHGVFSPCRALLDSASQLHCITSSSANLLQLKRCKTSTHISGIGQSDVTSNETVNVALKSTDQNYATSFSAVVVSTITANQPDTNLSNIEWNIQANIRLADPSFYIPQRVDLLIVASLFFELLCVGQIRLNSDLPILQKTRLGWIISGNVDCTSRAASCCALTVKSSVNSDRDLHELVKGFWDMEGHTNQSDKRTREELQCEEHFLKSFCRLKSGEYSVRLPTKSSIDQLGDSYVQAVRRFNTLEKRFERNLDLRAQYSSFIKEYLELNHMSLVKKIPNGVVGHFLPHHCVLKAESTTTKLRVVLDASAPSSTGVSLNDVLMAGPTIQPRLIDTLLRFRSHKIAITADIGKMYRCVRMIEPDSYLQCIIWRDNPSEQFKIYKLDTVTYGTKSAAFLAIRVMHQLALDEEDIYPIGSKVVKNDFYVDDLISGGSSAEEVQNIITQTSELLQKGNFVLRKWCSNHESILKEIDLERREKLLAFKDGSDITKALGLIWNPKTDEFLFSSASMPIERRATKRGVLAFTAHFYDPLGLIGPIVLKSKVFLQSLWKDKLDWDESLPQYLQSSWNQLCVDLSCIDNIRFPRFVGLDDSIIQIHGFCDASMLAYGACVYVRAQTHNAITVNILCAKSRVAPLKTLTIPKLELCAAMLSAELLNSISSLETYKGDFFCWSDSTIVLSWLGDVAANYNVFIANRISNIQDLTNGMTWHHVPTNLNPADILSRGASPKELAESLQRIYGYVYRFLKGKNSLQWSSALLSLEEVEAGTRLLLRMVQMSSLAQEYSSLQVNRLLFPSSRILSLNPFLDSAGLIRVGGRLQNSALSFNAKHPVILPNHHPLTNSIIEYFHRTMLHAGPQALLATIRLQYWPIGGRKTVAHVLNKCIRCYRLKPQLLNNIMGNLPSERVQVQRPFFTTGVDFCGPFFYKSIVGNKAPIKCYICLFICFTTKAVHLELAMDLSTASFLVALKRFISLRGKPRYIWSDNATNFVEAKNELKELRAMMLSESHILSVHNQCVDDGIDWRFIPPRSPHFGGLWEASIKIAKYHIKRTIGLSLFNFEELRTLICQVAAIINSRPICPLSESPDDLDVLTPAHFLTGGPLTALAEPDLSIIESNRLSQWQRVVLVQQTFWKSWSTAYLTLLQERSKWSQKTSNITNGALILIKDENLPPMKWPMGRVIETIQGKDGVVRVAIIRTSAGIIRRAITKLCLLPNQEIESS